MSVECGPYLLTWNVGVSGCRMWSLSAHVKCWDEWLSVECGLCLLILNVGGELWVWNVVFVCSY